MLWIKKKEENEPLLHLQYPQQHKLDKREWITANSSQNSMIPVIIE